jgi:hypothetical protein
MKYKTLLLLIFICGVIKAQETSTLIKPKKYTYKIIGSDSLNAYVFISH